MHLVELNHRLMEAQGIDVDRIKPYTASCRFGNDVESLYRIEMTTEDISYSLSVPISFVQKQKARIAKANEERRRFLRSSSIRPWRLYHIPKVVSKGRKKEATEPKEDMFPQKEVVQAYDKAALPKSTSFCLYLAVIQKNRVKVLLICLY